MLRRSAGSRPVVPRAPNTLCLGSRALRPVARLNSAPLLGPSVKGEYQWQRAHFRSTPRCLDQEIDKIYSDRAPVGEREKGRNYTLLVVLLVLAAGVYVLKHRPDNAQVSHEKEMVKKGIETKPQVGGYFNLIDTEGRRVTPANFKGKWVMMLFGTVDSNKIKKEAEIDDRPEAMGLNKFSRAIQAVEQALAEDELNYVEPLYVTVNPSKDTPERLKEHLANFHPRIRGLTGDPAEVRRMLEKFAIHKESETGGDMVIAPSTVIYLFDPDFNFVNYFTENEQPEDIVYEFTRILGLSNRGQQVK